MVNTGRADSSGDKPAHNGRTDFGKHVVREPKRPGVMVDVSQVSGKTLWEVVGVSQSPVVASRSSCRALCGHPRNMTDEMIKRLAAKAGRTSWEKIINHIEHAAMLVGFEHVGLGSDFDGAFMPAGLEDRTILPKITAALLAEDAQREGRPEDPWREHPARHGSELESGPVAAWEVARLRRRPRRRGLVCTCEHVDSWAERCLQ
ncbi:MAG: dipeptidase [Deltaproteobacteria bacterium]|nr:dipeptidase [Deltaproteobacteria bacterium]